MPYLKEPARRTANHRGKERLVSVIAPTPETTLPGAAPVGWDRDGTAPRPGEEANRWRYWRFDVLPPRPWPPGVMPVTDVAYAEVVATREATKPPPEPEPVPREPELSDDEIRRLRSLLR